MPTIDAKWGSTASNAYVTVVDADSFLVTTLFDEEWLKVSKQRKEILILTATRSIDQKNWSGGRYYYDQILEFPRTLKEPSHQGEDPSLFSSEWNEMITKVKNACAIQAVWEEIRKNEPDYRLLQMQGIRSVSKGGGNTNTSLSFGSFASIIHPDAFSLLKQWKGSKRVFRG